MTRRVQAKCPARTTACTPGNSNGFPTLKATYFMIVSRHGAGARRLEASKTRREPASTASLMAAAPVIHITAASALATARPSSTGTAHSACIVAVLRAAPHAAAHDKTGRAGGAASVAVGGMRTGACTAQKHQLRQTAAARSAHRVTSVRGALEAVAIAAGRACTYGTVEQKLQQNTTLWLLVAHARWPSSGPRSTARVRRKQ